MLEIQDEVPNGTSDDLMRVEIIEIILKYLNARELREARLVSQDFNEIICTDPALLWNENQFLIDTQPAEVETDGGFDEASHQDTWEDIRLFDLVMRFECPNFHFEKINLLSPGALKFFESSARYQITHLKITECNATSEVILHILACVSESLEHLEIVGFSKFKHKMKDLFPRSRHRPQLQSLVTIKLQSHSKDANTPTTPRRHNLGADLPLTFLSCIFKGTVKLERIVVSGWGPETCHNFLQVLSSMSPEQTENIHCLEMSSCVIENGLDAKNQFSFLGALEVIKLPSLRKLSIGFNGKLDAVPGLSGALVEDLTNCVATFLEHTAENLEILELINCPVSNAIFRPRLSSFTSLRRVNSSGSLMSGLDENGNPYSDPVLQGMDLRQRRSSTPTRNLERVQITNTLPVPDVAVTEPLEVVPFEISQVYKGLFVLLIFVPALHWAITWAFQEYPRVGSWLEILIHTSVTLWIYKGRDIKEQLRPLLALRNKGHGSRNIERRNPRSS